LFDFQKDPLVDVRIACNMIHIRSCSDSANALIELLKYVISEGDLQPQQQQANEISRSSTPIEKKRIDRPVRIVNDATIINEQLITDDVKVFVGKNFDCLYFGILDIESNVVTGRSNERRSSSTN
jgi:hypothetical protein